MLTAVLAGTGAQVVLPEAVSVVTGDAEDEVRFVDAEGREIAIFSRKDLMAYTNDGTLIEIARAAESNGLP